MSLETHSPLVTISPFSLESVFGGASGSLGTPGSAVWPSASRAIYIPFILRRPLTVTVLALLNGITVGNGTVQLAIYDESPTIIAPLNSGAQTTSGASAIQSFDVTDTTIGPGLFYFAIVLTSASDTVFRVSPSTNGMRTLGCAQQASAAPLPASATFAAVASNYLPVVGLSSGPRTFI